jgi:GT2 family glycosyltransferase
MAQPQPAVSIVLPAFNRLDLLRRAIESVFAQTSQDWELIVADDGSALPTRDYLRSIQDSRVRVLWLEHCGNPAAVRNAAIGAARAPLVAFLDSDDWWTPHKLTMQVAAMARTPQRAWSYTRVFVVDVDGRLVVNPTMREWRPLEGSIVEALLRIDALVATPTVMVTRELLERVGGFDAEQEFGEDYDMWIRLALASEAGAVAEPLAYVRVHRDHYSADHLGVYRGWMRLYQKYAAILPQRHLRSLCRGLAAASELQTAVHLWSRPARRQAIATAGMSFLRGWLHAAWWRTAFRILGSSRRRAG